MSTCWIVPDCGDIPVFGDEQDAFKKTSVCVLKLCVLKRRLRLKRRDFLTMVASAPISGFNQWRGASPTRYPLVGYIRTNWSRDPFSFGSYSYLAAGSGNKDREILAAPIEERVFFAGEALNPNYQSSVHAAHDAGILSANHVLSTSHTRIAIIGAGMSGLSAAHLLTNEGRDVTVFEGRDRIGGRIWTDRSLGAAVDLGATWIHGPIGNPITALADKAGLKRVKTDDTSIMRGKNGRRIWQLFGPRWMPAVVLETSMGVEMDKINQEEVEAAFNTYGLGYEGPDVKFPNGYDEVFSSLAGDYEVRLSSTVQRITYSNTGVSIEVQGAYAFDAVIVTVPLGVLKQGSIAFDPPLSSAKKAAISRMGMGTLDKLYLLFEDVFWDEDVTTILTPKNELPRGQFNYWVNFKKYLDVPILLAFNAATQARELSDKSDEVLINRALRTLDIAYPG